MKTNKSIIPVVAFGILICATGAIAANYAIKWSSINGGGGMSSSSTYKMGSSIGQAVTGRVTSASYIHNIGFWVGDSKKITVLDLDSLDQAKKTADGEWVSLSGKVATSGSDDRFGGFFYIEESTRASGIRVVSSQWPIADLNRGSVVKVVGMMATSTSGERQIEGSVVITGSDAKLAPVGMNNKNVGSGNMGTPPNGQVGVTGGVGTNNVGLLIRVWGNIIDSGTDYIIIDDGSGTPVRIDTAGLASVPGTGYINVTGISSLYKSGSDTLRLVIPRKRDDIQ